MTKLPPSYDYLDKSVEKNVKNFVYRGGDDGIIFTYFWKPFCDRLIELFPTWVP